MVSPSQLNLPNTEIYSPLTSIIDVRDVGKTVGGTRGNVLLDYVSLAPNKGGVVEVPANAFDYSELEKYGYSYLSTPIMEAGGRLAMYDLMGLEKPALKRPKKANTSAPSIIIDRTGETDKARYSGLKLGQILDDDMQANALVEAERKAKQGESLRPKLIEEEYERPFADVRNTGPKEQPYWTAERLDEWGKQKGKSLAEAKRLREEALVADRMESLDLELPQRLFSILTGLLIATAFGKSTPTFLSKTLNIVSDDQQLSSLLDLIKVPALALLLACVGSSVLCGMQASGKKRNSIVWTVKGLLGGPLSVTQLRGLPTLVTRREMESQERTD